MKEHAEEEKRVIGKVKEIADRYPYYKYNGIWSRQMENMSFGIVLAGWLGGYNDVEGTLLTYEQVAEKMGGTSLPMLSISDCSSHGRR